MSAGTAAPLPLAVAFKWPEEMGDLVLTRWTVAVGQHVSASQVAALAESDLLSLELRSPLAGTVKAHTVEPGTRISQQTEALSLDPCQQGCPTCSTPLPAEHARGPAAQPSSGASWSEFLSVYGSLYACCAAFYFGFTFFLFLKDAPLFKLLGICIVTAPIWPLAVLWALAMLWAH